MNEQYKRKIESIKNMPYSTYVRNNTVRSIHEIKKEKDMERMKQKIKKVFKSLLYVVFGYGAKEQEVKKVPLYHGLEESSNFRKEYRVGDPHEEMNWALARHKALMDLTDGRGDPPEHDCNCDHDDR